ncbi:MAG: hypothetical protein NTX59_12135 [Elusimicrobia bacterium]|nr:hypothetical protein [Elusimicrobiota bacterium]
MKKIIIAAAVVLGFSGGVYAESAIKQLEAAYGMEKAEVAATAEPAATARMSQPPMGILNDAYHNVDISGNSDDGASRGAFVLKKVNKPSGYTMTNDGGSLVKTATLGSADFNDESGLLVRVTYHPDGTDYSDASGAALFAQQATPSEDIFTGADGKAAFTKTATDGETDIFTCADGTACLVRKAQPWGDEFFVNGQRIMLRAACPGGDVFYGADGARMLVRVAEPGGDSYYRPAGAPALPDIVKILQLTGNPTVWRAVLFDFKRGLTHTRIIWPIPSLLY